MKSSKGNDASRRQFLKSAISGVGLVAAGINVQSTPVKAAENPLVLAKGGISTYSILLSESASISEQHSAEELQKFLAEMSGVRLPIITDKEEPGGDLVLVGDSKQVQRLGSKIPFAALGAEGFVIRTEGRHLVIARKTTGNPVWGVCFPGETGMPLVHDRGQRHPEKADPHRGAP